MKTLSYLTCCFVFLVMISPASAESPTLSEQIDAQLGNSAEHLADDAEFHRRAFLDLVGMIPTADETRAFLAESSPTKREQLIDRLLDDPRHPRHLQYLLDEAFMEQQPDKYIPAVEWEKWLRNSFAEQKPLDKLVEELLTADGTDKESRPAAKFLMERVPKPETLTRDIGRILLGRDMECAQCHDHPSIDDYLQRHYYGIRAFVSRTYLFTDKKSKLTQLGEKAEGDVKFTSVFTNEDGETMPRILDFPEIKDPPKEKDAYIAKPTSAARGIPKYSRRLQLAKHLLAENNVAFRENLANRIWAMVMGRGFVEPLDMFHSDNPATHPEVLKLVANELKASGFQLDSLIKQLMLTNTYQLSSEHLQPEPELFKVAELKPLTAEQLSWSILEATGQIQIAKNALQSKLAASKEKDALKKIDDAEWLTAEIEKRLAPELAAFSTIFKATVPGRSFDPTADQALFLSNGKLLLAWLGTTRGGLIAELLAVTDDKQLTEDLYLSVLSRLPTSEESADTVEYLASQKDARTTAVQELAWALLTSAEFRLNH